MILHGWHADETRISTDSHGVLAPPRKGRADEILFLFLVIFLFSSLLNRRWNRNRTRKMKRRLIPEIRVAELGKSGSGIYRMQSRGRCASFPALRPGARFRRGIELLISP